LDRSLRHPSILLLMGVCTERRNLAIVTEFVAGRDLGAIIRDRDVDMTVRQKLNIAKGIAQGPCLHAGVVFRACCMRVCCVCCVRACVACAMCVACVAKGGSICSQA
jgi:hypothetical protein